MSAVRASDPPAPTKRSAKILGMVTLGIPYIEVSLKMGHARGGARLETLWLDYFSAAMYVVPALDLAVRIKNHAMTLATGGWDTLSTVPGTAITRYVQSGARLATPWLQHYLEESLFVVLVRRELTRTMSAVLDKVPVEISATVSWAIRSLA